MNILKENDMIIYYHNGKEDLLKREEAFSKDQIGLGYFDDSPVRICPRPDNSNEHEYLWHVLLRDTGNKEVDKMTLNKALAKFNRSFGGEL